MKQGYHGGRFEWFVVAIVIALISLTALKRYALMADDARILRMEILAHRLMTGAANARAEFIVNRLINKQDAAQRKMQIADRPVYFSAAGWPVAVTGPVAEDYQLTEEDCAQLWRLLLQNPVAIGRNAAPDPDAEYQLSSGDSVCRFELATGNAFFDYYPLEGRMRLIKSPKPIKY